MGSRSVFGAVVLGPDEIPRVTSVERAEALPELAVLSALAHGNEPRRGLRVVRAAIEAAGRLDEERGRLYADVILARLDAWVRAAVSVKKASDLLDSSGASPAQSTTASRRKRAAAR